MAEPVAPRNAAGMFVATRDGRVLIGERSAAMPFLGGFAAFPGGGIDESDRESSRALFGDQEESNVDRAAALRELAEETGVALDGRRARQIPADLREQPIARIYSAMGIRPARDSLAFAGRWITPDLALTRFDTRFFLAVIEETCPVDPSGEFAWAKFAGIDALLAQWRNFELLLSPPTRFALEVLALGLDEAPRRLVAIPDANGDGTSSEFEPVPAIAVVPLRTPTLPPARHTNAYIIGEERLVIVDPATYEKSEREKLLDRIEVRTAGGATVDAIVLTHHHVDHVGAAEWLKGRLGVPIAAHPITRELLRPQIAVDRTLEEGDTIELGAWSGGGAFRLSVLFTPGHAPGHIVLVDERTNARNLIVGDMIAGIGTIIIDPPEGDMAEYLRQLDRLRERPRSVLFPAHGPAIADGGTRLALYIAHRLMREDKVWKALARRGESTAIDLLDDAYDDTSKGLYPLAARSCLAHLEKLVHDGRVVRRGDRFAPA